ncbi:NO-inducible flavohemoprotein [Frateuria aurantia]|uniref:nitric oxide dioxygenase n=1 Tax=Frateuria aurantia (strain ATCC 33424 / DSM 6220 / KCTC 2777 / LMG 1558 / NBRC 3245 / NCIMB 13370) TaxID=767434 RepID=H8L2V6_FRAAD|nr:NO-inducible flavohemoprotein [Frateuria aurantia]AFC87312.1 hemoglobin-like flavoprotein [Frateuria aurantia DSM 6220]
MLTDAQREIIKATVPLLETGGEALTTHFYKLMLSEYPEVRPLFNQANQASGAQPRALAHAVLMYARHIDDLDALGPLAAQIVNKHVALQILPEHYPIVGSCLLRSIREVLGAEIATDAVIEAWAAAYQQLADMLIGAEASVYDALATAPGGWRGGRKFRLIRAVQESSVIRSLYLQPVDGGEVLHNQPGQYIGLRVVVDGVETRRNYSLSASPDGREYRISVKQEPGGVVSGYLHALPEGAELELFPPAGEFVLADSPRTAVFISGGVGITPTLPMMDQALATGKPVVFVHYSRNPEQQAFGQWLQAKAAEHSRLQLHFVHDAPEGDGRNRPSASQLAAWLPQAEQVEAYFLGPKPFMLAVKHALAELGVPAAQMHCEFFGPAEELA